MSDHNIKENKVELPYVEFGSELQSSIAINKKIKEAYQIGLNEGNKIDISTEDTELTNILNVNAKINEIDSKDKHLRDKFIKQQLEQQLVLFEFLYGDSTNLENKLNKERYVIPIILGFMAVSMLVFINLQVYYIQKYIDVYILINTFTLLYISSSFGYFKSQNQNLYLKVKQQNIETDAIIKQITQEIKIYNKQD